MGRLFRYSVPIGLGLICFLISSCEEPYVPKPLGFMRIEMVKQEYKSHNLDDVLSFDLSDQCHIEEMSKTSRFEERSRKPSISSAIESIS